MKARVKATGEIVDVRDCGSVFYDYHGYVDINRNKYLPDDLEDYVIAYKGLEEAEEEGYDREKMQEYIPTYRCEERIRDARHAMIERLRELQRGYENDLDESFEFTRDVQLCAKISLIEKLIRELED